MSRLELTDNLIDVITKMSDGNPGSIAAMMEMNEHTSKIDPTAAFGGAHYIMMLDTWGIYGTDIYILYNDKCDRNIYRMILLLRGAQIGAFDHAKLKNMAGDQLRVEELTLSEDEWSQLEVEVCEAVPEFTHEADL